MINLEKMGFSSEEVLQRSQLTTIIGGSGDAKLEPSHTVTCGDGTQIDGQGDCPSSSSTACDGKGGMDQCVQVGA